MDINLISTAFGNKKQVTIVFYGGLLKNRHLLMIKQALEHSPDVIINRIINVSSRSPEAKVRVYDRPYSQLDRFVRITMKECSASKWFYQTDAFAVIPVSLSRISAEGINSLIHPLFERKEIGMVLGRHESEKPDSILGMLVANRLNTFRVIGKNYDLTQVPLCMIGGIYAIKNSNIVRNVSLNMFVSSVFLFKRIVKANVKIKYTTSLFGYTVPDCSFTQFYQHYKELRKLEKYSGRYYFFTRMFLEFIVNPLSFLVYSLLSAISMFEFALLRVNKLTSPQFISQRRRLSFQV